MTRDGTGLWIRTITLLVGLIILLPLIAVADDEVLYDVDGYVGAELLLEIRSLPEGFGEISRPSDVATDSTGRIIVLDNNDRVLFFDSNGQFLKTFGTRGRRPGEFRDANALTVDKTDRIFVADSGNNRVQVFDPEGNYLFEFGEKPPRRGEPQPGQLARAISINISPDDYVYVVDIDSHRVHVFNLEGQFQYAFGEQGTRDGQLNYPVGVGFDADGYVCIVNALNFRIEVFSPEGEFDSKFGRAGDTKGCFSRPKTIAADSEGNLYVTDSMLNLIQILDYEGEYLGRIGGHAEIPLFAQPFGIWIDAADRLYVADRGNNRIMVFNLLELE